VPGLYSSRKEFLIAIPGRPIPTPSSFLSKDRREDASVGSIFWPYGLPPERVPPRQVALPEEMSASAPPKLCQFYDQVLTFFEFRSFVRETSGCDDADGESAVLTIARTLAADGLLGVVGSDAARFP
jgi:hypothetical protein